MRERAGNERWRGAIAAGAVLVIFCFTKSAAAQHQDWPHSTFFTVVARPGDTLSGIAARYGARAMAIARLNALGPGSEIFTGEILRVPAVSRAAREAVLEEALDRDARNYAPPAKSFKFDSERRTAATVHVRAIGFDADERLAGQMRDRPAASRGSHAMALRFTWPVAGPVISRFGLAGNGERNDGINIAAKIGEPIRAAAAGTVTYAGDGLRDYGNLVLIEHADGYVTAYAHARTIAVARGERVEKGQVIGTAGQTGQVNRPQLHFEIRKGIKPVNPSLLLAATS